MNMVKKSVVLHDISHLLLPFLILFVILYYSPNINVPGVFLIVLVGSFIPDIDHVNILRNGYFKNFWEFIRYCLSSDRYRKSFLIFHNFVTILILVISIPIISALNIFAGIFLLSILAHIILDFLTDRLLLKTHGHWKLRGWI